MKYSWPEEVDVVGPEDICRRTLASNDGRHCLYGLVRKNFPNRDACTEMKIIAEIGKAAFELGAAKVSKEYPALSEINDALRNSRRLIARIWNRSMAKIGYVVGNPEARYVKRLRRT